ncbi:MAG: hypothetical protein ACTSXX_00495 [Candidatus Baldrarchaeia archaeon]
MKGDNAHERRLVETIIDVVGGIFVLVVMIVIFFGALMTARSSMSMFNVFITLLMLMILLFVLRPLLTPYYEVKSVKLALSRRRSVKIRRTIHGVLARANGIIVAILPRILSLEVYVLKPRFTFSETRSFIRRLFGPSFPRRQGEKAMPGFSGWNFWRCEGEFLMPDPAGEGWVRGSGVGYIARSRFLFPFPYPRTIDAILSMLMLLEREYG